jgi:drug/metabolite transporter (DMT)-like permease
MLLAIQKWLLSLACVLIALYPATTVMLALIVLRERLTRWQGVGLILGAVSVGMIAAN